MTTTIPAGPPLAMLSAEYGSPLWCVDLDRVRANLRALRGAFDAAGLGARVAYSYKTNRLAAILAVLHAEGALAEVVCPSEFALARAVGVAGPDVVVNGPVKPDDLLSAAAEAGALVVADSAEEAGRALALGVGRLGLRVTQPGATGATSRFGIPAEEVPGVVRALRARGAAVEALHAHSVSTDLTEPPSPGAPLASRVAVRWPRSDGDHAALARVLGSLARACGVPVVDIGGGQPPAAAMPGYARAVAAALRAAGFAGALVVEPGRALVADAVDLVATVHAVRTLADGRRVVIVDAGTNLLPGALWSWPSVEALAAGDPAPPAVVSGPLCLNTDILNPAAALPAVAPGALLAFRGVGAYHMAQSSQFGEPRPAVLAQEGGAWRCVRRRETVADIMALDGLIPTTAATAPPDPHVSVPEEVS